MAVAHVFFQKKMKIYKRTLLLFKIFLGMIIVSTSTFWLWF